MRRRRFHVRFSSVCMVIGILISIYVILNILSEYNRARQYEIDSREFGYRQEASLYVELEDPDCVNHLNALSIYEGVDVFIQSYYTNVTGTGVHPYVAILLQNNIGTHYSLVDGNIPDIGWQEPCIAAGRFYDPWIQVRDGNKYLQMEQKWYRVTGTIGCPYSIYQDAFIVISYESMTEELRHEKIQTNPLILLFRSDERELDMVLQQAYEELEAIDPNAVFQVSGIQHRTYSLDMDTQYLASQLLIIGLCVFLTAMISYYWIQNRLKEMGIRKIFGQTDWYIFKILFRDACGMIGCAVVLYLIVYMIAYVVTGYKLEFCIVGPVNNMVIILAFLICFLIALTVVPMCVIVSRTPKMLLRGRKR